MIPREPCPQCGSQWYKRNGHIHTGKRNHLCKLCGRAFVLTPENCVITAEQRTLIERLLLERISLWRIYRAVGIRIRWLMDLMVTRFGAMPMQLHIPPVTDSRKVLIGRLEVEADEL